MDPTERIPLPQTAIATLFVIAKKMETAHIAINRNV